ncbi:recombinase family protein [Pseudomonas stutzeri]|uniref:recombinase family protein n=1 Tax=Stutzerimonas stutzeri TaxID=316 RepID=UPI00210B7093|nr:recombinase family protein [Stutzerimonas stutzeri]MCQ4308635.1 recombinase family protein [Stutzerimonas stutzeri]
MKARLYLRASTKEQDSHRAEQILREFAADRRMTIAGLYAENISGTKLERPELIRLLDEAEPADVLLCESVDRLSRLSQGEWKQLRSMIECKGLRLVVVDLPTTHQLANSDDIASQVLRVINDMLLDLMATMARLDQQKRVERIKQGLERRKERGETIKTRGKSKSWVAAQEMLLKFPDASADEIARLAKCGVATVYRAKAELPKSLHT